MKSYQNVFVVDDDASFTFLYKEMFSDYDFYEKLMTFSNLDDFMAVLLMDNNSEKRNLLISDLNLVNTDAVDYLHNIASQSPNLFNTTDIIISSCSSHPNDVGRAHDSEIIRLYADKPLDIEQVLAELAKSRAA